MTWVKATNVFALQWFFVRLARVLDEDSGEQVGWGLIGPVLPLTGWWSDFIGRSALFVQWKA